MTTPTKTDDELRAIFPHVEYEIYMLFETHKRLREIPRTEDGRLVNSQVEVIHYSQCTLRILFDSFA
jgi:hypothetical protein